MIKYLNVLIFLISVFFSCNNGEEVIEKKKMPSKKELDVQLLEANKKYVKRESDEIDQYVKHQGWKMNKTGTGLRYFIRVNGIGELANVNDLVEINYRISLLDGTVCYSSDSLGSKTVMIGHDNVETGLHEAMQLLRKGDEAVFILPSHLAHGLHGDEYRIPSQSSVLYEVELLEIKNK